MKFGEHRGGMFVEVTGDTPTGPVTRSWHLLAEGDDGPLIPSMAIEAIIRKMLNGEHPESGARAATNALTLDDYAPLFAERTITTGTREVRSEPAPLYERILGSAFNDLPTPLRDLHTITGITRWSGQATVTRGTSFLARLAGKILNLPEAGENIPVSVTFTPDKNGEHWERNFNCKRFSSYQSAGTGRNTHLLTERFGLIKVALALVLKDGELDLIPRRWSLFGIPLPKALLPQGRSYESAHDGVFTFDVTFKTPFTGPIATYSGQLTKT